MQLGKGASGSMSISSSWRWSRRNVGSAECRWGERWASHGAPRLAAHHVLREEEDVGRSFGEPAHQVVVPVGAVRRGDQHAIVPGGEVELILGANAIEHLELEEIACCSIGGCFID